MTVKENVAKTDKQVRKSHKHLEKMMKSYKLVKHCQKLVPKNDTKEWKKWQKVTNY